MTAAQRLRPELWVLRIGVVVTVALIALHAGIRRVPWAPQWGEPESTAKQYFDVSREQNLPTWVNVVVLVLAAVASTLAAALARVAGSRAALPWAGFAVVVAGLSLDDMTSLHERLDGFGRRIGGGSGLTYAAWLVPGLAFAAVVVIAVVLLVRRVDRTTRRLLLSGLFLLLVGAFALESLGNAVLEQRGFSREYALLVLAEETLETLGAWLLLAAPLAALRVTRTDGGLLVAYPAAQSVR
ncbi:MAG: hypothetical protein H0T85_10905 [Geodermatophilaceae bacterium]|nr:hypothetical protein [Geodermatophilaceae bacterium]